MHGAFEKEFNNAKYLDAEFHNTEYLDPINPQNSSQILGGHWYWIISSQENFERRSNNPSQLFRHLLNIDAELIWDFSKNLNPDAGGAYADWLAGLTRFKNTRLGGDEWSNLRNRPFQISEDAFIDHLHINSPVYTLNNPRIQGPLNGAEISVIRNRLNEVQYNAILRVTRLLDDSIRDNILRIFYRNEQGQNQPADANYLTALKIVNREINILREQNQASERSNFKGKAKSLSGDEVIDVQQASVLNRINPSGTRINPSGTITPFHIINIGELSDEEWSLFEVRFSTEQLRLIRGRLSLLPMEQYYLVLRALYSNTHLIIENPTLVKLLDTLRWDLAKASSIAES